jgi:hypothetical protein
MGELSEGIPTGMSSMEYTEALAALPEMAWRQTPEQERQAALDAVTEATREVVAANQGLFTAMRERQARRKEALDLGATLAEVQAAIAAGQPAGWRPQ